MSAGGSAERWAAQLRADARRGLWRRSLAWLGLSATARRADAQAADCEAGAVGEARTADLLRPLELVGWTVLHDRAIPGARRANADHILVSPGGRVFLVDSKLWSGRYPVHGAGGTLWHGEAGRPQADRSGSIRSVLYEAELIERALGVPVQPVIAMHNAAVDRGGFMVGGVPVVPAGRLVEVLQQNDGPPAAGAAWLAQLAAQRLPRYPG